MGLLWIKHDMCTVFQDTPFDTPRGQVPADDAPINTASEARQICHTCMPQQVLKSVII